MKERTKYFAMIMKYLVLVAYKTGTRTKELLVKLEKG